MAMDLFLRIEKEFARKIPLTAILTASTIRQQAEILINKNESMMSSVIPVKSSGKKHPVIWIPSGFGVDLFVQGMAKYFDQDQPLYLLSQPDASVDQFFMVDELAKIYADAIRQSFPAGPYYLAGHSGGGIVACATANELMWSGGEVGWVGLLDTAPLRSGPRNGIFESFQLFVLNMIPLGFLRSLKDLYRNLFIYASMSILRVSWIQSHVLQKRRIPIVKLLSVRDASYMKVFFTHRFYRPAPFMFDLVVFKATGIRRYGLKDRMADWKKQAVKGLKFIEVPGDHVSIMEEPNVGVLAKRICENVP
jgi:thioesterase domain-containing protein